MSITINNSTNEKVGHLNPTNEELIEVLEELGCPILTRYNELQYRQSIQAVKKNSSPANKAYHHRLHEDNAAYYILTKVNNKSLIDSLVIYESPAQNDADIRDLKSSSVYDAKKDYTTPVGFITRIALDNHIKVYYRVNSKRSIRYTGYKPVYEEHCGQYKVHHYQYITDDVQPTIEQEIAQSSALQVLSQAEKDSLSYKLKYYDLDYPHSEAEWMLVKEQVACYEKHNIDYAFDTNQFYICPECKGLARIDEPHECFSEIHEYNKLDYIVNGGE